MYQLTFNRQTVCGDIHETRSLFNSKEDATQAMRWLMFNQLEFFDFTIEKFQPKAYTFDEWLAMVEPQDTE